jgi:hypothetical protein
MAPDISYLADDKGYSEPLQPWISLHNSVIFLWLDSFFTTAKNQQPRRYTTTTTVNDASVIYQADTIGNYATFRYVVRNNPRRHRH